ncbi:uncharacterized protein BJ171DRAFT_472552 [Polychytrium aggregatum]|uniref:uncharacterized protein n=1 Tax=Polychytrium aggregatum TaxID=110093 RepID=UPI0022FDC6BC|nr:uncharacterized protein BJ171DRAFT_472552 [Polychytrium aggregatum]KAI9207715.1 hypothetical protein BJ171DRAFT_472552 [Polychytrium aggregatum]
MARLMPKKLHNQGKRRSLMDPIQHPPSKLQPNVIAVTEKARALTHGVQTDFDSGAAEVVFPTTVNPLLMKRFTIAENIKFWLPAFTGHPEFRFGLSTVSDIDSKALMYPHMPEKEGDIAKRQYIISHWSYGPGEQRSHFRPPCEVPRNMALGLKIEHDNEGKYMKEALFWNEEHQKSVATKLVPTRLSKFRERTQPVIGKVHDPIADTISHLSRDHTFGVTFPPDEFSVSDLLGYGPKAKAERDMYRLASDKAFASGDIALAAKYGRSARVHESSVSSSMAELEPESSTEWPTITDKAEHEKNAKSWITPKITGVPAGGVPRYASANGLPPTHCYGVPTVRLSMRRRPDFMKKIADNNNYGDELNVKALLSPTPRNTYGVGALAEYAEKLKAGERITDLVTV